MIEMRILHCSSGNLYGGVEVFHRNLTRFEKFAPLLEQEFALCFEGRTSEELAGLGAPVHMLSPVRFSRPWSLWAARKKLSQLLDQEKFDMVVGHAAWGYSIVAPVVKRRNIPLGLWLHNTVRTGHWLERLARRTTPDRIFVASDYVGAQAKEFFGVTPTRLGHPVELTTANPTARKEWRERLGVGSEPLFLQAARFEHGKGHEIFLKALSELNSTSWQCCLKGTVQRNSEREYLDRLKLLARSLGLEKRVHFLEGDESVSDLMSASDLFCHPNIEPEGYGLVFIEALAHSLPVITTDIGGGKELVASDVGQLVSPNETSSLVNALTSALDESWRKDRSAKARARAEELAEPKRAMAAIASALVSPAYRKAS